MLRKKRLIMLVIALCLMAGLTISSGETAWPTLPLDGPRTGYTLRVADEAGNPVAGAVVQFCNDTQCMFGQTDELGEAYFDAEPGEYTVHLLMTPEGYEENTEEFEIADREEEVVFTLKAATK